MTDDAFVSKSLKQRETLLSQVRARLNESETLLCVLGVTKISPSLNVLVVTTERVLAGWRAELTESDDPWRVHLAVGDVDRVEVTGFMDNVKFVDTDRQGTKVGNLSNGDDEKALTSALRQAKERRGPGVAAYEIYRPPGSGSAPAE